jgi:hypothetical protein
MNITESNTWEAVRRWETTDQALGGVETAPMNVPLKQLVNRSAYLKNILESIISGVTGIVGKLLNGSTVANTYTGAQQNNTAVASCEFTQAAIAARAGRRNMLLNGDMRISQRGSSFTLSGAGKYMTFDRWIVEITDGREAEVGVDQNLIRSYIPGTSHAMRVKPNATLGLLALRQRIANAWSFEGQKCTIQFAMYSPIDFDVTLRVRQFLDARTITDDDPQWESTQTVSILTGFNIYKKTFTVASLASVDVADVDIDSCFEVSIETTDTRTNDFLITNIQAESGELASAFEVRDDWNECLRYYEKIQCYEGYDDAQYIESVLSKFFIYRRQFFHHKRKTPHVDSESETYVNIDSPFSVDNEKENGCTVIIAPSDETCRQPNTRYVSFTLLIDAEI